MVSSVPGRLGWGVRRARCTGPEILSRRSRAALPGTDKRQASWHILDQSHPVFFVCFTFYILVLSQQTENLPL